MFLDNGADVLSDDPFAVAFSERIRTALRPFVDYKHAHPDMADQLQEQLDRALRYFAHKGDLKWVSLLMWAGGNPRSRGWNLNYDDDPDCYASALEEASSQEKLEVLKRLKPDPCQDHLSTLLNCAAQRSSKDNMRYLLELGANPNDKANGGSAAVDHCIKALRLADMEAMLTGLKRLTPTYVASVTLECIRALTQHGALWRPDDNTEMNTMRRALLETDPEVTLEFLMLVIRHKCCSTDTIHALLNPRMKEHVAVWAKPLLRLGLDLRSKTEIKEVESTRKASILAALMRRYDRQKLYDDVWAEPMRTLATKYNLSDVGLAKVCKTLKVPRPSRGYWRQIATGKRVGRRPLLPNMA